MSNGPIDIDSMFKEIELIYEKHNMPKMMGFVPDKLEIVLERKEKNVFNLSYSESFSYLPNRVLESARENAIQLIQQMGFAPEKTLLIENGVKVQMSGDSRLTVFLILELLLQNEDNESEVKLKLDMILKLYHLFSSLLDFNWNWNDETESKFKLLNRVMKEHPSILEEISAIIEKRSLEMS